MLKNLGRYRAYFAALAVAVGIVAGAKALGLDGQLFIVAPLEVVAGNPINGYVKGMEDPCTVNAWIFNQGPIGPSTSGCIDPLYFSYLTFEPMAPGVVSMSASDSDETDTHTVFLR